MRHAAVTARALTYQEKLLTDIRCLSAYSALALAIDLGFLHKPGKTGLFNQDGGLLLFYPS
ncbi:hypothetical protein AB4144_64310, partial [Rhizobiaceae sp. 2RAB30]